MKGISPSLWAENPEQGKLSQPNTPCATLLRSVALPAKPMWKKKFWHPTPSWRWDFPASVDQCANLDSVLRLGLFVFMKSFNNIDIHRNWLREPNPLGWETKSSLAEDECLVQGILFALHCMVFTSPGLISLGAAAERVCICVYECSHISVNSVLA